jgi:hypothetical protein
METRRPSEAEFLDSLLARLGDPMSSNVRTMQASRIVGAVEALHAAGHLSEAAKSDWMKRAASTLREVQARASEGPSMVTAGFARSDPASEDTAPSGGFALLTLKQIIASPPYDRGRPATGELLVPGKLQFVTAELYDEGVRVRWNLRIDLRDDVADQIPEISLTDDIGTDYSVMATRAGGGVVLTGNADFSLRARASTKWLEAFSGSTKSRFVLKH